MISAEILTSIENERAALGSALYNESALETLVTECTVEDFADDKNRAVFSAMVGAHKKHGVVDTVIIMEHLPERGIGYTATLSTIINETPASWNIKKYIDTLKEYTYKRRVNNWSLEVRDLLSQKSTARELQSKIENIANSEIFDSEKVKIWSSTCAINATFEYLRENAKQWIKSGFIEYDKKIGGFCRGEMTVVSARTSVGKSLFVMNIAQNVAKNNNVLVFSLEMTVQQLMLRMISRITGLNSRFLRTATLNEENARQVAEAGEELKNLKLKICDNGGATVAQICKEARKQKRTIGLDLLIVDLLEKVNIDGAHERNDIMLGEITKSLSALAKELHCALILVAQLNRSAVKDDVFREPELFHLQNSGRIEQDAQVVVLLHRRGHYDNGTPVFENKTLFKVAKNRDGELCRIEMEFDGAHGCFRDIPAHNEVINRAPIDYTEAQNSDDEKF